MATKYYDIESSLDKYSDSPCAYNYLLSVIERSCPNDFHWTYIDEAKRLKFLDEQENKLF